MRNSQNDETPNVLPFPQRAQCHTAMAIVRAEPDLADPSTIITTYRCPECGLLERRQI
jgi:hypothetical protein